LKSGELIADGTSQNIKQQFGLTKVRFFTSLPPMTFNSAKETIFEEGRCTVVGLNSDEMIREIISKDSEAHKIEIIEPSLEEVLFKLWKSP
jgi:ABC-type multidrug transport system ATPase subunit